MKEDFSLSSVKVAMTPMARFEEYLQSRGKRITQQRRSIVGQVFSHHEHFDADDLLAELAKELGARKVSRPTVYRTLSELVDAGLLRKMSLNKRSVYEHDYGYPQHDHLHCQACDRLIEFQSDELATIREAVGRQHNFKVTGHRLIITGICSECNKARQRPTRRLEMV
ncbi:MAG: transcriptional repressor [Planctomycetales bacterium]